MREWLDVHEQLTSLARELGFEPQASPASEEAIHRALLPGLLSRVGMWHPESRTYLGARQTRFVLHPGSALAKKPPSWVVVAELVETSRLFGRMAAAIDPTWLERAGGRLCKRSYGEAHFVPRSAQVTASEQVTLFGLPIVSGRRVHYGPIAPKEARKVFLLDALARGLYAPAKKAPFLEHNRQVLEHARKLRDRARRSDLVADEDALYAFFDARVPEGVFSGPTFEAFRAEAEAGNPKVLFLSLDDVLLDEARDLGEARFPSALEIGGAQLPLHYRFDPSEDDDGVRIDVPLPLVPQLDPAMLEWPIPAWRAEKIALLCHGLPKSLQRALGGIDELARTLGRELGPGDGPLCEALARALEQRTGVRVMPSQLRPDELPPYLRFYVRVVRGDQVLGEGRDLAELCAKFGARGREEFAALPKERFEREGLTTFPAEGLPESVRIAKSAGTMLGYPSLVEESGRVHLRLLASREASDAATIHGLRRLFLGDASTTLSAIEKLVPRRLSAIAGYSANPPIATQLAWAAVDEAFELRDPARWPRTPSDYRDVLARGRGRYARAVAERSKLVQEALLAFEAADSKLRKLVGKPGALPAALDDMRQQLGHLAPPDLVTAVDVARLAALPRYFRAIGVRLDRLPNGPQKDQSKAESVLPHWKRWLAERSRLLERGVAAADVDAFRWLVEEYRIAVFAPEIGPAFSISPKRLDEAWNALTSRAGIKS
jgi:ATP-dependent helicase HrpA